MLQSSAGLLYDVLHQYDPEHVLLSQAKQDVLRDEFDIDRLHQNTSRVIPKTTLDQTHRATLTACPSTGD